MLARLLTVALLLGVALASAKTYSFKLSDAMQAGTTKLNAGDYSLKVEGDKVILRDSTGHEIAAPAKIEAGSQQFRDTEVSTTQSGGTNRIEWIGLAGSKTKVVFE